MTNNPNSPNLWHALLDWFECIPVALKVTLHEPLLVGGALVSIVVLIMLPMGPTEDRYTWQILLAQLAYQFFAIGLSCRAIWEQDALMNEEGAPPVMHWGAVVKAFVSAVIYNLVSTIGMLFFVIPGVVFAVRTSLYVVFICLEDRGMINCFMRSSDLTSERFWRTLTYMVGPTMVIFVFNVVAPAVLHSLAPLAFKDTSASLGWILQYPLVAMVLILSGLIAMFAQISAMPLFTKLYVEYCDELMVEQQAT